MTHKLLACGADHVYWSARWGGAIESQNQRSAPKVSDRGPKRLLPPEWAAVVTRLGKRLKVQPSASAVADSSGEAASVSGWISSPFSLKYSSHACWPSVAPPM